MMKLTIIESPYAGDTFANTEYARVCLLNSLNRGEAPMASHLLYTQVLDDTNHADRDRGISAGHERLRRADLVAVYVDKGISQGMLQGILAAQYENIEIEYRRLYEPQEA